MIAAVIFDLDGTVLDNEEQWEDAFRLVADDAQAVLLKAQNAGRMHESGIGIVNNWRKIIKDYKEAETLARKTWMAYQDQTSDAGDIRVREGLVELVEFIKENGWQTALATGSTWNIVEPELEQLDLYLAFDVTTTGEEVSVQKPDPEIYNLTMQKMGVEPRECVVFEDSVAGVVAGVEAGARVIAISSEYASSSVLQEAGASFVVDNPRDAVVVLRQYGDEKSTEGKTAGPQIDS